ncbi:2TM domain-containing protein [Flavobacterium amniphilum]|uniref:2TM domain-containing protein n=1 Tax=Flavobacterium amniphilum TaxID=1834035 RepID=UPI00202A866C|nr:2TM domain-containing protein [Flavobacterium amniphilum]MCL9805695.1 2TM domain-containing protein [Flavobacterium amniphilum]
MEKYSSPENTLEELARKRVRKIKNFYGHLFIYLIGVAVYISKTYYGVPLNFIPLNYINEVFMWIWTFIMAMDGIKLFFSERVLGDSWEQKQISKIMNEGKNDIKKE